MSDMTEVTEHAHTYNVVTERSDHMEWLYMVNSPSIKVVVFTSDAGT